MAVLAELPLLLHLLLVEVTCSTSIMSCFFSSRQSLPDHPKDITSSQCSKGHEKQGQGQPGRCFARRIWRKYRVAIKQLPVLPCSECSIPCKACALWTLTKSKNATSPYINLMQILNHILHSTFSPTICALFLNRSSFYTIRLLE